MPLETNFDTSLDGWTPTATSPAIAEWSALLGNPSPGSAKIKSVVPYVETPPLSYYSARVAYSPHNHQIESSSDSLWFNGWVQSNLNLQLAFTNYIFRVEINWLSSPFSWYFDYAASNLLAENGYDSGWLQFQVPLTSTGHAVGDYTSGVTFTAIASLGSGSFNGQEITIHIDSVEFATSAPAFSPNAGSPPVSVAKLCYGHNKLQAYKNLET